MRGNVEKGLHDTKVVSPSSSKEEVMGLTPDYQERRIMTSKMYKTKMIAVLVKMLPYPEPAPAT